MLYVPRGCPHAFANPGPGPARMIFLVSPSGHEYYQKELLSWSPARQARLTHDRRAACPP